MLDVARYVNHLNQSIDFGSGGIFITDSELRNYEWEYDTDYDEMNRVGMTDGESIILYFSPDTLVGQYFEEV